ncbi:hypothetical protein HZH66_008442 [Vespula vulgaris]|uniref:Uncharacterized protein n=1 Tax=Vespula vulgaris TaxID=7454 RepID=A0A834JTC6_VESVU|nr:hypothetical protein HZH66_008442 [Vespula vulgaris]
MDRADLTRKEDSSRIACHWRRWIRFIYEDEEEEKEEEDDEEEEEEEEERFNISFGSAVNDACSLIKRLPVASTVAVTIETLNCQYRFIKPGGCYRHETHLLHVKIRLDNFPDNFFFKISFQSFYIGVYEKFR